MNWGRAPKTIAIRLRVIEPETKLITVLNCSDHRPPDEAARRKIMLNDFETKKSVARHFSKTKHDDPYAAFIYDQVVIQFLEKLRRAVPNCVILDIGCGMGTLERRVQAIGVDISKTRLFRAKESTLGEYIVADANSLPLHDGSFDVVHIAATLMHIPDHKGAIREASRVLRSNGALVIYEPNRGYLGSKQWQKQGLFFQTFSRCDIEKVLKSEGYRVIRSEYCLYGMPFLQGFIQRRLRWLLLLLERVSIPWLAREFFLVASK